MKTKAYSDMRFSLHYRHYSEKIFKKEDNNDHKNKLIIQPIKAVWKYHYLISKRKADS